MYHNYSYSYRQSSCKRLNCTTVRGERPILTKICIEYGLTHYSINSIHSSIHFDFGSGNVDDGYLQQPSLSQKACAVVRRHQRACPSARAGRTAARPTLEKPVKSRASTARAVLSDSSCAAADRQCAVAASSPTSVASDSCFSWGGGNNFKTKFWLIVKSN